MHGGTVQEITESIDDMQRRREQFGKPALQEFGMSVYVIVRDTEEEAQAELERITTVDPNSRGYDSFLEFTKHSQLNVELTRREYSVGTRGLRPNLVGTAEQVAERIREYEAAGLGLLLIQSSPLHEELERISETLFPLFDR
jgi:FMNH2-dependent dimethyl sulfone monooxygenase